MSASRMSAGLTEPAAAGASAIPPALAFEDVTVRFATPAGGVYTVMTEVSLDIAEGGFIAIVGPSGCGKSTLLNLAAGLMMPPAGRVSAFGLPLAGINPHAAYLFQQDALLPWRTVLDNVMLGLVFRDVPRGEAKEATRGWLARVGLARFEDRFPHQLSGGQRKRAALAQAWIVNPRILLMDEPFGALDVQTRQIMENELLGLWQETRKTVLFVTHDLEEAIALADRVIVLSTGPARVKGDYAIDLPRPRDVAEIRLNPEFGPIYRRLWADLRDEVLKSSAAELSGPSQDFEAGLGEA